MAQPSTQQVHTNTAMTRIAVAYSNANYIARGVFPIVPVEKQSDVYYVFTKGDFFRDEAQQVAPGHGPKEVGYGTSTCPYICHKYGSRAPLPDDVRDNADNPIQPATRAAEIAADRVELGLEIRVASLVTTVANWTSTTTLSSGSQWSADTSDPFRHITTAKATVRDAIGIEPNTVVMGAQVWDQLLLHPDMVDRLKYTTAGGKPTPAQLGGLFDVARVFIGSALKNTAAEGATISMATVWGKNFWIGYVAPGPSLTVPSAGYVFRFGNRQANTLRIEEDYKTLYDVLEWTDEVVTAADAGYLIASAVA